VSYRLGQACKFCVAVVNSLLNRSRGAGIRLSGLSVGGLQYVRVRVDLHMCVPHTQQVAVS